jgi:hypothetical protein
VNIQDPKLDIYQVETSDRELSELPTGIPVIETFNVWSEIPTGPYNTTWEENERKPDQTNSKSNEIWTIDLVDYKCKWTL